MYADAMRNPKVARLADNDFRLWVRLLALASENDGKLPCADDLKLMLSARLDHLLSGLKRLISTGLIDLLEDGYEPHNWGKRQYKSDTSTPRVTLHREKRNVSVTPPDTETDTDRVLIDKSISAAGLLIDPAKVMFDAGVGLLSAAGKSANASRSIIGKWRSEHGVEATIAALGAAQREAAIDPVAFIEARFRQRQRDGPRRGSIEETAPCL